MPINDANKKNTKSHVEKKIGWVSPFFVCLKVTILCRKNILCYETFTKASKLDRSLSLYMRRLAGGFVFSFQTNSDK